MVQINRNLTSIEKGFNVAGSLPGVAVISGPVRAILGAEQIHVGITVGCVGLVGQLMGAESNWEVTKAGGEHIIHGALNILRGTGELALGVTIVGPLIPLTFQAISKNGFAPRVKYEEAKTSVL